MADVIAVFGISGVGKTWLASRLAAKRGMRHVQAGELMRQAREVLEGRPTTAEDLRKGPVLDNQTLLLLAFNEVRAAERRHIIFDGHSVVDTGTGLVEVPVAVIEGLCPGGIVFIRDEPHNIAVRRSDDPLRRRPQRSAAELAQHQRLALKVCEQYCAELNIPIVVVVSGDLDALDRAVRSIVSELGP